MNEVNIRFTKHALRRARERKLWKYVNKKKFFYDAKYLSSNRAILDECIYAYVWEDELVRITTMYRVPLAYK